MVFFDSITAVLEREIDYEVLYLALNITQRERIAADGIVSTTVVPIESEAAQLIPIRGTQGK